MARRHDTRAHRKGKHADPLERLRQLALDQDLLHVLDSLPQPDLSHFQPSQDSDHDAIKLFLGHRPKSDGLLAQSWARVVANKPDLVPPVMFYDKENGRAQTFPRSATSILRKATYLEPPFCFLQHDPIDKATDVRGMLCALILYEALVTGADTCALQWDKFEDSFCKALQHISTRHAYRQWRDSPELATDNAKDSPTISDPSLTGGTVRPGCHHLIIRPNTSLARLRGNLSERNIQIIATLPPIPMTLSPHNLGDSYFPFRMRIGSHELDADQSVAIYAYFKHDGAKTNIQYLSHDDTGKAIVWTVDKLLKAALLEPFDYLNKLKKSSYGNGPASSARAAKIRSLVSYYFFLAENEGLIGDPLVAADESCAKRLCSAARELQDAKLEEYYDGSGKDDDTKGNVADVAILKHTEQTPEAGATFSQGNGDEGEISRVVRLVVQSDGLEGTIKNGHQDDQEEDIDAMPHRELSSSDELPMEGAVAENVQASQIEKSVTPEIARGATHSRPTIPNNQLNEENVSEEDMIELEANDRLLASEDETGVGSAAFDYEDHIPPENSSPVLSHASRRLSDTPLPDGGGNDAESEAALTDSHQANILVAQVIKNRPSTPEASVERETKDEKTAADAKAAPIDETIIDLCSDDGVPTHSPAFHEATRRTPVASRTTIDLTQVSSEPRGTKRRLNRAIYLPDSDDDVIEETDGSAYRQARWGRRN
ncbi:hypothetical protein E8E13_000852 [Curvularia kusanoi]|uniref:Uncharacterized protein n=1 Tax=Curvularia kusanoi TaxID=90978 RepID=A0A9P4T5D1_CURKU|nr:hypothetical protein E8E13_000852 [Curvularia kusanoi]